MARQIRDGSSARAILAPPTTCTSWPPLLAAPHSWCQRHGPPPPAAASATVDPRLYGAERARSATAPTGRTAPGSRAPDGTMAARAEVAVPGGLALLAQRGEWAVSSALVTIIAWNEEPRLPRLPRERGLGGRDRGGGRRVGRQDGADRPRFTDKVSVRPWPGFAARRTSRSSSCEPATGSSRSTRTSGRPPSCESASGILKTTARGRLLESRGGTSSGGRGCATAASIPNYQLRPLSGGAPGASWRTRSTVRSRSGRWRRSPSRCCTLLSRLEDSSAAPTATRPVRAGWDPAGRPGRLLGS